MYPNFFVTYVLDSYTHAIAPAAQVSGAEQLNAGRAKTRWRSDSLPVCYGVNPFVPGAVA